MTVEYQEKSVTEYVMCRKRLHQSATKIARSFLSFDHL